LIDWQNGLGAIHLAAKEGHIDIVNELLSRGVDVNTSTNVNCCDFLVLFIPCLLPLCTSFSNKSRDICIFLLCNLLKMLIL